MTPTTSTTTLLYTRFGASVSGTSADAPNAAHTPGVTFLLDGGSNSANGLTVDTFEGVENGIVWITFEYGDKPGAFTKENPYGTESESANDVWMRVAFTITTDSGGEVTAGDDDDTVYAVINTTDSDGTLYAIPYKIRNDQVIEKTKKEDVNVSLVGLGTFAQAVNGVGGDFFAISTQLDTSDAPAPIYNAGSWATEFLESVDDAEEADLIVTDEDTPPVPVQDRQELVEEAIASALDDKRAKDISIGNLKAVSETVDGGVPNNDLTIGGGGDDDEDKERISTISADDLSGLVGLKLLDLRDNLLTELPAGVFASVGSDNDGDLGVTIDLRNNEGPGGDGFTLDSVGAGGTGLNAGQVLLVNHPEDDDRKGFLQSSYSAVEGGVVEIDVNVTRPDAGADGLTIQFVKLDSNSGNLPGNDDDKDVNNAIVDLSGLVRGNYRIAIGLPENDDEDSDNTLTMLYGHSAEPLAIRSQPSWMWSRLRSATPVRLQNLLLRLRCSSRSW